MAEELTEKGCPKDDETVKKLCIDLDAESIRFLCVQFCDLSQSDRLLALVANEFCIVRRYNRKWNQYGLTLSR